MMAQFRKTSPGIVCSLDSERKLGQKNIACVYTVGKQSVLKGSTAT